MPRQPDSEFVSKLRSNILATIKAARADGTTMMALGQLKQVTPTPSPALKGAPAGTNAQWLYHEMFTEICAGTPAIKQFTEMPAKAVVIPASPALANRTITISSRSIKSLYDSDNFAGRVNYAAACISRQSHPNERAFDTCFEMFDGEVVTTALVRRSATNQKLADGIRKMFGGKFPTEWQATAAKYADTATKDLPALAKQLREKAQAAYALAYPSDAQAEAPQHTAKLRP